MRDGDVDGDGDGDGDGGGGVAVVQLGVEQATTEKLLVFPQNLLHSPIAVTVCNYAFTHRIPPSLLCVITGADAP